jgi:hypothetical protein
LGGLQFKDSFSKQMARPHLKQYRLGMLLCTCHPSYARSTNRIVVQGRQGIQARPYMKMTKDKIRAGAPSSMAQGTEHLTSKHEALRSNPSMAEKIKII